MDNIKDEDLDYDRQLGDADNKWHECTDVPSSDRRKRGFRCFQNIYVGSLLHYFPCYEYEGTMYYHVIDEHITTFPHKADYHLMTAAEIKRTYGAVPIIE